MTVYEALVIATSFTTLILLVLKLAVDITRKQK